MKPPTTRTHETFAEWLQKIYGERFTGKITLEFCNGMPQGIEMPGPHVRFSRTPLDKSEHRPESLTLSKAV